MVKTIGAPRVPRLALRLGGGGVLITSILLGAVYLTSTPEEPTSAETRVDPPSLPTKVERRMARTARTKLAATKAAPRLMLTSFEELSPHERTRYEALTVLQRLKADEARRAMLIEQRESLNDTSYVYRISGRADMEDFLQQLCRDAAERHGLDAEVLRMEVDKHLRTYLVPEGHEKLAVISVPKMRGLEVTYLVGNQQAGTPFHWEQMQMLDQEDDTVALNGSWPTQWRFDNLMDLREPQ